MSWRRLWNTLRPHRLEREIDREVAFHLAERTDDLRAQGLSETAARAREKAQFGNATLQAERTRDADVWTFMDARLRDARYAMHSFARTPGFALTVILTLALGIGANAAVFSVIDAALFRPLPFPRADRLVDIRQVREGSAETKIAPVRLEDWNRMVSTFEAITGYYTEDVSDTSGAIAERVRRAWVAPRFLAVWGVAPAVGRGFVDAEYRTGGPAAVLISDRYWRDRLGADPHVLRRTVRLGAAAFPIVGVLPASFLFPDRQVDLWLPVGTDAPYAQSRLATWYSGVGRLKPGVSLEQARANVAVAQAQLARQFPASDAKLAVGLDALQDTEVGSVRHSLWLVYAAVWVLLLITCTNVAALLLSRAAGRQHEISVRLSLGASRSTLVAQLLTETFVLSVAGAAAGLMLAMGAIAAFRSAGSDLPRADEIAIDVRVLAYTLGATIAAALLCGVLPAIRSGRQGPAGSIQMTARTVTTTTSLQWLLVGAQVALSVTLLAGAGLLLRSLHELSRVNPGFDARGVLTFRISGHFGETADFQRLRARIDTTIERLRALPGAQAAATAAFLPGVPSDHETGYTLRDSAEDSKPLVAETRVVSPEYFATLRIPLADGELCRRQPIGAPTEVMVNRAFVAQYLTVRPSAIGLELMAASSQSGTGRIAGVVADVREAGLERQPLPAVYWCLSTPNPTPFFLVRTAGQPTAFAPSLREAIHELEPLRSVYEIAALDRRIDDAFAQDRLRTALLTAFATTALALVCVGAYGTLSYGITLRRREVGLRLALGARRSDIVRYFLLQALRVVGAATAIGLLLTFAFTRLLSGMLYGVSATDPVVIVAVIALVLGVGALAALVPSLRASRVEPLSTLREG